jgi:hypothetical protein
MASKLSEGRKREGATAQTNPATGLEKDSQNPRAVASAAIVGGNSWRNFSADAGERTTGINSHPPFLARRQISCPKKPAPTIRRVGWLKLAMGPFFP